MPPPPSKNIYGFDPRSVPGCQLWFDAADASSVQYSTNYGSPSVVATGGTITTTSVNGVSYRTHTFTSTGDNTFTLTSPSPINAQVLIVGGGGGGGADRAAGGGGGGLIFSTMSLSSGSYTATVGAGGIAAVFGGGSSGNVAGNGGSSSFNGSTAVGGGGAGQHQYYLNGSYQNNGEPYYGVGRAGGSGGGGAAPGSSYPTAVGGSGTSGQGNAGGTGYYNGTSCCAGGGGGAGSAGQNAGGRTGGAGGNGLSITIGGTTAYYAGGGGGSSAQDYGAAVGGAGGLGGGGRGGSSTVAPLAGTANTGGGGGGAGNGNSGGWSLYGTAGGSGVIIISYAIPTIGATGGTTTDIVVGGTIYRNHAFTTVGNTTFTLSSDMVQANILVVGGGGGGGGYIGGGGGGGQVQTLTTRLATGSYTIAVGAGGTGQVGTNTPYATDGGSSSMGSVLTAVGGGGQGSIFGHGGTSGSFTGGTYYDTGSINAGGGAGAAQNGANASTNAGNGGNGVQSNITGTATYYGGGGGGGQYTGSAGTGGYGGGANGAPSYNPSTKYNGTNGLGGGGGGSSGGGASLGGDGGSGVVIISYAIGALYTGSNVSVWQDKSGNGYDLTSVGSNPPIYSSTAFNGYPCLVFTSGLNQDMATVPINMTTFIPASAGYSYFAVFNQTGGTCSGLWFQQTGVGSGSRGCEANGSNIQYDVNGTAYIIGPQNTNLLLSVVCTTGNQSSTADNGSIYLNGTVIQSSQTFGTASFNYTDRVVLFTKDSNHNYRAYGYAAEFMQFNRALTSLEQQQIEGYLAWKWGLNVAVKPPTIPNCILWLDAGDSATITGTTTMSAWKDKSGKNNNCSFSGAVSYSSNTVTTTTSSYFYAPVDIRRQNLPSMTLVIVYSYTPNSGTQSALWGSDGNGGGWNRLQILDFVNQPTYTFYISDGNGTGNYYVSGLNTSYTVVYTCVINNHVVNAYVNGISALTQFTENSTSANGDANIYFSRIQTDGGFGTAIKFNEILMYSTTLTSTQIQSVNTYLTNKWTVTGTNVSATPSTLPSNHLFYPLKPFVRQFNPTDIDGCVLWLDGADGSSMTLSGTTVTQWNDKSGNGNSTTTTTGTSTWTASAINGLNAVQFNSASWFLGPSVNNGAVVTVFAVGTMTGGNSGTGARTDTLRMVSLATPSVHDYASTLTTCAIIRYGTTTSIYAYRTGTGDLSTGVVGLSTPFIACSQYDGTNHTMYVNGTAGTPVATSGNFGYTTYGIGCDPALDNTPWNGFVGEVIIYNAALTTQQRQQVEGYLAAKWGLKSSLPPPVTTLFYNGGNGYSGSIQNYTVPNGVTSINVALWGGGGASSAQYVGNGRGGSGAYITGTLAVTPGEILGILVAGYGGASSSPSQGGYGGGGYGNYGANTYSGGPTTNGGNGTGGGGRSAIQRGGTDIVTVGGGGGAGYSQGGDAAWTGTATAGTINGGGGGTSSSGGAAGSNGNPTSFGVPTAGSKFQGGNGNNYGGGGGGGWYGGGGGNTAGGAGGDGGGGSSYTANLTNVSGANGSGGNPPGTSLSYYKSGVAVGGNCYTTQIGGPGLVVISAGPLTSTPSGHPYVGLPPTSTVPFIPTNIAGCQVWFDGLDPLATGIAPANSTSITTWFDKSGYGYNATVASGRIAATYSDTYNSVYFQSSSVGYATSYPANPISETMFIVANIDSPSSINNNTIIGGQYGARSFGFGYSGTGGTGTSSYLNNEVAWQSSSTPAGSTPTGTTLIATGQVSTTTNVSVAINGATFTTGSLNAWSSGTTTYLGVDTTNASFYFKGYVMEILFYNSVLTVAQRQQIEGYLAKKWNISKSLPSSHGYYNFEPSIPPPVVVTSDSLYTFGTFTFTNCGKTGATGPILSQCVSAYSAYSWTANTAFLNMTTQGYQRWTVPTTAPYIITAAGAGGNGGSGAVITIIVNLTKGDIIQIVVGQRNMDGGNSCGYPQTGNGGTFVVTSDGTPLVIAGGGGGTASKNYTPANMDASLSTSGNPDTASHGSGGSGGYGGGGGYGCCCQSGGGGGFYGNGNNYYNNNSYGGSGFNNGATGGADGLGTYGGFGGGGGVWSAGGGGGGYSGGSGGGLNTCDCNDCQGGGGGGSYYSVTPTSSSVTNTSMGYVTIVKRVFGPPDSVTVSSTDTFLKNAVVLWPTVYQATSYTVKLYQNASNSASGGTLLATATTSNLTYTFTGLTLTGGYYAYATVFATNSTPTDTAATASPTALIVTMAPTNVLNSTNLSAQTVTTTWAFVDHAYITNYTVKLYTNTTATTSGATLVSTITTSNLTYTFTGLSLVLNNYLYTTVFATGTVSTTSTVSSAITQIIDALYSFTSITFTNCGASGTAGPILSQCVSTYSGSNAWVTNTSYLNMTTQGYQRWTAPTTDAYSIVCAGAGGTGGSGAIITVITGFTKGDIINIVVGQQGTYNGGSSCGSNPYGGSGGSFVVNTNGTIYVIAGGAGGTANSHYYTSNMNARTDQYGQLDTKGYNGNASGGNGGSGGNNGCCCGGAGGGGFSGNGGSGNNGAYGGSSYANGLTGGTQFSSSGANCVGGFGGGGSGWYGGGGGGGYSGGAGGGLETCSCGNCQGGGGGGSYSSTTPTATAVTNGGMGYVTITALPFSAPATVTVSLNYAAAQTAVIVWDTVYSATSYTVVLYVNSSNSNTGGTQIGTYTTANTTYTFAGLSLTTGQYAYATVYATKASTNTSTTSSNAKPVIADDSLIKLTPSDTHPSYTGTTPTFGSTFISFNPGSSQYLDFGSQTYSLATLGFTAKISMVWTSYNSWARVIDFNGGSAGVTDMFLTLPGTGNSPLRFQYKENGAEQITDYGGVISLNTLYNISVVYNPNAGSATGKTTMWLNGAIVATNTGMTYKGTSKTLSNSYVGKSSYADAYLGANIYSLYIYNRALPDEDAVVFQTAPPPAVTTTLSYVNSTGTVTWSSSPNAISYTVTLYQNTSSSTSGGTQIGTASTSNLTYTFSSLSLTVGNYLYGTVYATNLSGNSVTVTSTAIIITAITFANYLITTYYYNTGAVPSSTGPSVLGGNNSSWGSIIYTGQLINPLYYGNNYGIQPAGQYNYQATSTGYFYVPSACTVLFHIQSDDGALLIFDGTTVLSGWFVTAPQDFYSSTLSVSAGYHTIRIYWFDSGGGGQMYFDWSINGGAYTNAGTGVLYHDVTASY